MADKEEDRRRRPAGPYTPTGGYSEPTGYMAGRDDDFPSTAGSGEKSVSARSDEVEGEPDPAGPSPEPVPGHPGGAPVEPGHPDFRVRGPVDEAEHGQIDDEDPSPDDPDGRSGVTAGLGRAGGPGGLSESAESAGPGQPREPGAEGGHVTAGLDWTETDADDPDAGSGRT